MLASMDERKSLFARNLKALNSQFKSWIDEQYSDHLAELWSDGVEDYLKHAKKLLDDFKDVLDNKQPDDAKPSVAPLFQAPDAKANPFSSAFGSTPALPTPAFAASQAGTSAPTTQPFGGFGNSTLALFGASTAGTTNESFAPKAAANNDEDSQDEEDNAEPKVEIPVGNGAEMLFKGGSRLQALNMETKKWVDKGAGVLTIRKSAGKAFIVFTAGSGKVFLNAGLQANSEPTATKVKRKIRMNLLDHSDGKPTMRVLLFTLDSDELAEEFTKVVLEHKP